MVTGERMPRLLQPTGEHLFRSVVLDHDGGASPLYVLRHLRTQASTCCVVGKAVAVFQTSELDVFGHCHEQCHIHRLLQGIFEEQGDFVYAPFVQARGTQRGEALRRQTRDLGMNDGVEGQACCIVAKDKRRESFAIEFTIVLKHSRSEARDNRRQALASGGDGLAGKHIGVDNRYTCRREHFPHSRLARSDPARQSEKFHVFLRSHDRPVPAIPVGMQVHLVDGTFELFRCFFGAPPRINAHGIDVGATRAFVGTLLTLLKDATHVGVAFDTVIESFRNDLYAGYKTGEGMDEALRAQMPLVERGSRALGLVTWSMVEHECDDALATMAVRAARDPRVTRVNLCSPDKDLAQVVVGDRIVLVDRIRDKVLDEVQVTEKFGVPPALIADLLALVGDDADGVPGLAGFGKKSAAAVLLAFGALERIPAAPWPAALKLRGADKLAATLDAHRADAALFKRLTTLVLDVPLTTTVDDLAWQGPDQDALASLARELDDEGLVARVQKTWKNHAHSVPRVPRTVSNDS
jgi:5'-3' exonuclease